MLREERDRHSHRSVIIRGNVLGPSYFDGIEVIIRGVVPRHVALVEDDFLVALGNVEVSEPAGIPQTSPFLAIGVHPVPRISRLVILRNLESHVSTLVSEPNFAI